MGTVNRSRGVKRACLKDPEPDPKRRRVQLQEPIVRHSGIQGETSSWLGFPHRFRFQVAGEDIKHPI